MVASDVVADLLKLIASEVGEIAIGTPNNQLADFLFQAHLFKGGFHPDSGLLIQAWLLGMR
jgi:hypothetical protein